MNFEIIDNIFQIVLLLICGGASMFFAVTHRSRLILILSLFYTCFAMGTLYFVLHLFITEMAPQIFYVSEISWIASYAFLLSFQILRSDGMKITFSPIAAVLTFAYVAVALERQFMLYVTPLFVLAVGSALYLTLYRLIKCRKNRALDVCTVICLYLQFSLYMASLFIRNFDNFNLYFAIDFALSATFAALLPLSVREVLKK